MKSCKFNSTSFGIWNLKIHNELESPQLRFFINLPAGQKNERIFHNISFESFNPLTRELYLKCWHSFYFFFFLKEHIFDAIDVIPVDFKAEKKQLCADVQHFTVGRSLRNQWKSADLSQRKRLCIAFATLKCCTTDQSCYEKLFFILCASVSESSDSSCSCKQSKIYDMWKSRRCVDVTSNISDVKGLKAFLKWADSCLHIHFLGNTIHFRSYFTFHSSPNKVLRFVVKTFRSK